MKSNTLLAFLVAGCAGVCTAATAQDLGALKKAAGGGADFSSLASGSAGNAAGVIEYCVKNNYLGGDAASSLKDKLLGKVNGSDATESDKSDYAEGAKGLVKTGDGNSVDLGKIGGDKLGGLKDKVTKKACSSVLDHAKSFL